VAAAAGLRVTRLTFRTCPAVGRERGPWIDTNAPDHRGSSRHARLRSNESVFASLVKPAHVLLPGRKADEQAAAAARRRIHEGT
jgi:hypothetical protein